MGDERRLSRRAFARDLRINALDADRSSPRIEQIEDVSLAEFDAHRAPPRSFCVIPLAVLIEPAESHFQRHSEVRPSTDLFERRADNADQMSFVLAAQIGLDLSA